MGTDVLPTTLEHFGMWGWFRPEPVGPGTIEGNVGLSVAYLTDTSIRVTFSKPTDADFQSATVLRSSDGASYTAVHAFTDSGTWDDTGLTANTVYYYQVVAMDNDDTVPMAAPPQVLKLNATAVAGSLDTYETSRSRNQWYQGQRYFGERIFEVPKATLPNLESSYLRKASNVWPGYASAWSASHGTYSVGDKAMGDGNPDSYVYKCTVGHTAAADKEPPNTSYWTRVKYAPYAMDYFIERDMPERPGYSLLRVLYGKPTATELLRRVRTDTGTSRAILNKRILSKSVRLLREPGGDEDVIEGYADDDVNKKWVVESGSNIGYEGQLVITLRAAATSTDLATYKAMSGYRNSAALPHLDSGEGWATQGTLLFIGYEDQHFLSDGDDSTDELLDVTFVFLYEAKTWWESQCKVALYEREKKTISGVSVLQWGPVHDVGDLPNAPESRDVTKGETSFAVFDAMMAW